MTARDPPSVPKMETIMFAWGPTEVRIEINDVELDKVTPRPPVSLRQFSSLRDGHFQTSTPRDVQSAAGEFMETILDRTPGRARRPPTGTGPHVPRMASGRTFLDRAASSEYRSSQSRLSRLVTWSSIKRPPNAAHINDEDVDMLRVRAGWRLPNGAMAVPMTRTTARKAGRIAGWAVAFGVGCAVAVPPRYCAGRFRDRPHDRDRRR